MKLETTFTRNNNAILQNSTTLPDTQSIAAITQTLADITEKLNRIHADVLIYAPAPARTNANAAIHARSVREANHGR